MGLTIRFTYMAISRMIGFSLFNSFIKKLYSTEGAPQEDAE